MSSEILLDSPPAPSEPLLQNENRRYELVDGEWVEKKMGALAGQIAGILIRLLGNHTDQIGGVVLTSDGGYKIFPHAPKLVRFPDVSYLRKGRLPNDKAPDGNLTIPPDLIVEVVSPNDLAEEIEERAMDFLRVGVSLVWIIYPKTRCVRVLRQGGAAAQLLETDDLQGENVLPGFSCKIEELLPKK
jgi:Uma2 family endonuclease